MFRQEKILFKGKTALGSYQIIDMVYEGRKARVLFSGNREAAFSGMPLDDGPDLLFDYIQRFYELVAYKRPSRLLIIGGGVHTLSAALLHSLPDIQIDAVEIDPGLTDLAARFCGFKPNSRLNVYSQDGKSFLLTTNKRFDMIIIDAFSHLRIPSSLTDSHTAQLTHDALSKQGITAINVISSYSGRASQTIKNLESIYKAVYPTILTYPADNLTSLWSSQNLVLVAEKGKPSPSHGLRFHEVNPDA